MFNCYIACLLSFPRESEVGSDAGVDFRWKILAVKGEKAMKKTYRIEVDCANCANLMEEAARKVSGVADATVNFMTLKMKVEFAEGAEPGAVMAEVLRACRKVEPDCEIYYE